MSLRRLPETVGAARGLNDTPKIAAVAGYALLPAGAPAAVTVTRSVWRIPGDYLTHTRPVRPCQRPPPRIQTGNSSTGASGPGPTDLVPPP